MITRNQTFFAQVFSILGRSSSEFHKNKSARWLSGRKERSSNFFDHVRLIFGRAGPEFKASRKPTVETDIFWSQQILGFVVGTVVATSLVGTTAYVALLGLHSSRPHHLVLTLLFISSCILQFGALLYATWRFFRLDPNLYSVQRLDSVGVQHRQEEFKQRISAIRRDVEVGGASWLITEEFRPRGLRGIARSRYTLKEYGPNIVLVESLTNQAVTMYAHGKKHKEVLTLDYVAVDGSKGKARLRLEGDTLKGEFTNTTYKQSRSALMKRVRHQFA